MLAKAGSSDRRHEMSCHDSSETIAALEVGRGLGLSGPDPSTDPSGDLEPHSARAEANLGLHPTDASAGRACRGDSHVGGLGSLKRRTRRSRAWVSAHGMSGDRKHLLFELRRRTRPQSGNPVRQAHDKESEDRAKNDFSTTPPSKLKSARVLYGSSVLCCNRRMRMHFRT